MSLCRRLIGPVRFGEHRYPGKWQNMTIGLSSTMFRDGAVSVPAPPPASTPHIRTETRFKDFNMAPAIVI